MSRRGGEGRRRRGRRRWKGWCRQLGVGSEGGPSGGGDGAGDGGPGAASGSPDGNQYARSAPEGEPFDGVTGRVYTQAQSHGGGKPDQGLKFGSKQEYIDAMFDMMRRSTLRRFTWADPL